MKSLLFSASLGPGLAILIAIAAPCCPAQDADDPYFSVWKPVAELLRRREYGNAIALLDASAEESELAKFGKQIESDKAAITGLQMLERLVREQAARLAADDPLDVGGVKHLVIRFEKSMKGDALVLKQLATGREARWPIGDLPAAAWLHLAGPRLKSLDNPALTQGIFLGFDRSADPKAARKFLNDAAGAGGAERANVTLWLARLEGVGANAGRTAGKANANGDPAVGRWRIVMGKDQPIVFNMEIRANGASACTFPRETIADMRKRKIPPPKNNPQRGKWVKNEDGSYRDTNAEGGTVEFIISGDRLIGKTAKGLDFIGLRQTKP